MKDITEVTLTNGTKIIINKKPIASVDNRWRQRLVKIHSIPDNEEEIISIGCPYAGGNAVICKESIKVWAKYIGTFHKVIE